MYPNKFLYRQTISLPRYQLIPMLLRPNHGNLHKPIPIFHHFPQETEILERERLEREQSILERQREMLLLLGLTLDSTWRARGSSRTIL